MPPFNILEKIRQLFLRRTTQTGKVKRTLRLVQLEDRRMLNGAIAAAGINLTGIETLTISQGGNVDVGGGAPVATVNLSLTNGTWTGIDAGLNGGLYDLDATGKILTVDASVLGDGGFAVGAGNELHILGDAPNSQHVNIDLTGVTAADSFIPSNGIDFSGGESDGDADSLSVSGYTAATVDTLTLSHTGAESGTIILSGLGEISFSEIEPLALGGTAANLIINLPAGADPTVRLTDNGVIGDGISQISGAFELTTFANPTVSLTINDGTGVKAISVRGLDSLFDANVSILEDDAVDDNTVTFEVNSTDIDSGALHVEAGPIALNASIITTGNVELLSTDAITDGNGGIVNITAATATLDAVNGIGSGNAIETNITQLEATNTTAGLIAVTEVAAGADIALGAVNNGTRDVIITAAAGAITDGNGATLNITAGSAGLTATAGIGSSVDPLETMLTGLAFRNNNSGEVSITNSGALTIASVDVLTTSSNAATGPGNATTITATSPITFAVSTSSVGTTTYTSDDDNLAGNDDNITVNAGVTVEVTGASSDLILLSGDRIIVNATAIVRSTGAGGNITLSSGFADADNDGSMILDGAISANTTVTLDLNAEAGSASEAGTGTITAANLLLLSTGTGSFVLNASATNNVATLAANSDGSIAYRDSGALTVGTVGATSGITTTNDDITLFADGGAAGVLTVNAAVSSGSGNIRLRADDDVTFAAAGDVTSTSGNVEVTTDFDASGGGTGGALTMVDGTVINAGTGTISLSADGDIALGSVQTANATVSAVVVTTSNGNIVDGGDADIDIVTTNAGSRVSLTATNGNIGASSPDVFKGVFNPIEVALAGNLTASAPFGSVAIAGPVAGTQMITALTLYVQSAADLDVSATVFTFTNLALITAGKLTIANTGLAVTGDLRIEANDVDAATAGNAVLLGSAGTRIDRLLYQVTNAADEPVGVFTDQLDVLTVSNVQVHVNGDTQFRDLNCDLTSFNTNGNTGVVVSIGGTITQGTEVGTIPGTELNDKLLSQNLLLLGNGTICLDHQDNDVNTIAGQLVGTSSLFFNDIDNLIVGAVSSLYAVPAPAFPVLAYNGLQTADGNIHVRAGGSLTVNQAVTAGAAGNVLLASTGAASDIVVNAAISSGTANITLNAGRDIDLNATATTGATGTVYMLAGNNISVDATVMTTNGDILLRATGNITQTALITTTNGDVGLETTVGNINQTATGDVTTTNGDVLVDAGNNWTMANGTEITVGGQDLVGRAGGTITLGQISMTNGTANRVALQAIAGDIADANGATVNIEETVAAAATSVSFRAGGLIGAADAGNGTPPVNVNAIDLNVDSVAASSATGIYLREIAAGGAITVDQVAGVSVSVDVAQVNFKNQPVAVTAVTRTVSLASLEDLRTTTNGPVKLVAESGTVTVHGGSVTPTAGISANGTGDVLLEARGPASDVRVNASIASGTGHITLNAGDDIDLNASLSTGGAGSAYLLAANGTADAADPVSIDGAITTGNGNILIQSPGNIAQTATITTTNGDVGLVAVGNITQAATGDVASTGGDVLVNAGGNWTMANGTVLSAGGQDLVGRAGGTIRLGTISMTNATVNRVALQAVAGDILDANGVTVNIEETVAAAETSVSLRASGMIGAADAANGTPAVNINAIDLNVDSVAALATTGIYLREIADGGAITVRDVPAVTVTIGGVEQVNFNSTRTLVAGVSGTLGSLEDLITTPPGGPIKLVAENGTITVEGGTVTPAVGVVASNAGDILLEARGVASDLIVNASIATGTGHITLSAGRDIDLNATATTAGSGTVYMLAGNNIEIDATVTTTDGDILLRATGNITQTALITTTNGDVGLVTANGNISQSATGDVTTTNGDVLVDAGNNWTMVDGTVIAAGGQDVLGRAGGTIALGQISMTNGTANRVALQAVTGNIADANGATVNIEETVAAAATSVSFRAGGMIGAADAGNGTPPVNVNAIDLNLDSLAASAGTGIYLREIVAGGAIAVRDVSAVTVTVDGVQQVSFNSTRTPIAGVSGTLGSLEDLRTGPPGGAIKLIAENGTITVEGGTVTPAAGVVAASAGDILLEARGAASDVIVNAGVTSGTGHVTLNAGDDIDLNANIATGGAGTVYLLATNATADAIRGIDMQGGTSVTTGGGNVRFVADNESDIQLGLINAGSGDVSLIAERSILDNNAAALNVQADELRMVADSGVTNISNQIGIIGGSDVANPDPQNNVNAIDTQVTTLAAQSADGIYVREANGLTVDSTGAITVQQVNFNSTVTAGTDLSLSDLITTDSSPIKLQSVTGSLVFNEGDADNQAVSANGNGDVLLQTLAADGDITTNSRILSGTGHITLNAGDDIDQNATVTTGGAGSVCVLAGDSIGIDGTVTTTNGDILIHASGSVSQTAAISTTNGNVGLVATANIVQTATGDVTSTNSDVLVDAGGNWTMAIGTVINVGGQDFLGRAGGTITLGTISMTDAAANRVALQALAGDILDGNAAAVNIEETEAGSVTSLSLRAGGRIGASGGIPSLNGNAMDLNVDTVAARAATGIYLREIAAGGSITVDNVAAVTVSVDAPQRVDFRSTVTPVGETRTLATLEDLTTTADGAGIEVVAQQGTLTVNPGTDGNPGVLAGGNDSQIYLEAAGDVVINANVTAGASGTTSVDDTTTSQGEQIHIRSIAGNVVLSDSVTISTDEDTTPGHSSATTSDNIEIASGGTHVRANAASGTNQIDVVSVAGIAVGDSIIISDGDSAAQTVTITAITGTTLTLSAPLNSDFTTAQNATVSRPVFTGLTANALIGQNQVNVADATAFSVGDQVIVSDGDSPPQAVTVTAVAGNTLTLSAPLAVDLTMIQNATVRHADFGEVRVGTDVVVRTDGGVATHFYDRVGPDLTGTSLFVWGGIPIPSTVVRDPGTNIYTVTFTVTIGVPGGPGIPAMPPAEENLRLDIDWRDPTVSRIESFDLSQGTHQISHEYMGSDFNVFLKANVPIFFSDFSVSQHESIQVLGGALTQDGVTATKTGGPLSSTDFYTPDPSVHGPYTTPNSLGIGDPDLVVSNTESNNDFHFEDGLVEIRIPTAPPVPIIPDPPRLAPPAPPVAAPNPVVAVLVNVVPVEVAETPFSSFSTQSEDYFQLRDGVTGKVIEGYEHIADEFGELLLQPARLKQWVTDENLQDQTDLELWLITSKQTGNGHVTVERPVLKFDIADGRPFPASEPMPEVFEELKLLPLPLDDNLNDQSSPAPGGSDAPVDDLSPETENQPKDGDNNGPNTDGQTRFLPGDSERGATESDDEPMVTATSPTSRSILTSVAVAAVLNKSRVTSIAPSKSRQLLSRMVNRQGRETNLQKQEV